MSSRSSLRWLWVLLASMIQLLIVLGTFQVGKRVGMYQFYREASSMLEQSDAAAKMTAPTSMAMNIAAAPMRDFALRGEVVDTEDDRIFVRLKGGEEQTVFVSEDTRIRSRNSAEQSTLEIGDIVFVVGSPDSDGIHASAIAILGHSLNEMDMFMENEKDELY